MISPDGEQLPPVLFVMKTNDIDVVEMRAHDYEPGPSQSDGYCCLCGIYYELHSFLEDSLL